MGETQPRRRKKTLGSKRWTEEEREGLFKHVRKRKLQDDKQQGGKKARHGFWKLVARAHRKAGYERTETACLQAWTNRVDDSSNGDMSEDFVDDRESVAISESDTEEAPDGKSTLASQRPKRHRIETSKAHHYNTDDEFFGDDESERSSRGGSVTSLPELVADHPEREFGLVEARETILPPAISSESRNSLARPRDRSSVKSHTNDAVRVPQVFELPTACPGSDDSPVSSLDMDRSNRVNVLERLLSLTINSRLAEPSDSIIVAHSISALENKGDILPLSRPSKPFQDSLQSLAELRRIERIKLSNSIEIVTREDGIIAESEAVTNAALRRRWKARLEEDRIVRELRSLDRRERTLREASHVCEGEDQAI